MTHRVRDAFGRFLALGVGFVIALVIAASPLVAQQTTGKIEGTVSDQAGVPIANAQVFVVGTSFGAITNEKGYYFINNVPVGTYTVRGQFIGYAPSEVRGIRVLGGQTITTDIKMQSSAVVLTGVTVTAAANPIVPRDQVTSKAIVSGDLVSHLPVDDVRAVVALTPGVVESGDAAGVSIRGGRPGEANIYIDGAPIRGTNSGSARVSLGTNAVEEASVTTGALGVEFADAQSGVLAFTTRSGTEQLSGSVSMETDEPFGDAISVGWNRLESSVGGPVPGVPNLRFFGSTIMQGQLSDFRAQGAENVPRFVLGGVDDVVPTPDATGNVTDVVLPQYVQYSGQCGQYGSSANAIAQAIQNNYGFDCQGRRAPLNWQSFVQFQGNLQYTYGTGSSLRLTGLGSGDQSRNSPGTNIGAPTVYTGTHSWNRLAVLNWVHQVSRSAERALSVNVNLSWARDRSISGALSNASDVNTRSPRFGVVFGALEFPGFANFPFPITDEIIRELRNNSGGQGVPLINRTDLNNAQPYRVNPYGMSSGGWSTSGFGAGGTLLSETRYTGRLIVDWQANRFHRFKFGGDAKKTDLAYWNNGSLLRQIFMDAYVVHPVQYGLFAADRLDLGDVVLELGGRWDYYDSRTLFATTPGRINTHPEWDTDAGTDDAVYQQMLNNRDIFTPSKAHSTISPRLLVSFPITEQTGFRLSYAHQVQTPEFTTLLTGVNNDLAFTNTNDTFGRDLDFGKTILFEFGVRHAFSPDLVLDVSAYNKDKVSDYAARIIPFFPDPADATGTDTLNVNILTNRDFGNARGVDVKFDWRVGQLVSTTFAYTFQVSKNTGSDPFSYLNTFARQVSGLTGDRTPPPDAANRTNDDRTHNLVGAISLTVPADWRKGTTAGTILRDVSVFATMRVQSGLAYTRLQNNGDGQTAPRLNFGLGGRAAEPLNASTMPWTKFIDMRINKGFKLGRADITAYADIRNVFNFKNIVGLYAETGDVVNAVHRGKQIDEEYLRLYDEAGLADALDGQTVNLTACGTWGVPVNCEALQRVEARFGDGNGLYTRDEQEKALNTFYDSFFGAWRFNGQPRHVRVGFELSF
jgi:hypothetical protein